LLHLMRVCNQFAPPVEPLAAACEIRVLDGIDELVASYRLRYEVYGHLGYITRNRSLIELDPYDPYAIPFGAFDAASGALIGTLRLVTNAPQAGYVQAVCHVLAGCNDGELVEQASRPRPHPLPSMISPAIRDRIDEYNRDGFVVEELSRTIVHPGHRGAGVSRGLMEFGLAYAALRGPRVLVGGCLAEHVAMYAKYGYALLPQATLDFFDSVGQIAHAVVCRTDSLPQPTRAHVDQLLPELRAAGARRLRERGLPVVYRPVRGGAGWSSRQGS
jgi:GNAT superfamily N-acetyltransferase